MYEYADRTNQVIPTRFVPLTEAYPVTPIMNGYCPKEKTRKLLLVRNVVCRWSVERGPLLYTASWRLSIQRCLAWLEYPSINDVTFLPPLCWQRCAFFEKFAHVIDFHMAGWRNLVHLISFESRRKSWRYTNLKPLCYDFDEWAHWIVLPNFEHYISINTMLEPRFHGYHLFRLSFPFRFSPP